MAGDLQSPDGAWWTVRRRWWPVREAVDTLTYGSVGADWVGVAVLAITLPFVLVWPLWFAAKMCGLQRWVIVIECNEEWVATEKARWWSGSVDRIAAITAELRSGTYPAQRDR